MVVLLIDDHAHRVMNNTTVQSAVVKDGKILEESWGKPTMQEMNLTGGQLHTIQNLLMNVNMLFPKRKPMATVTPQTRQVYNPHAPMGA